MAYCREGHYFEGEPSCRECPVNKECLPPELLKRLDDPVELDTCKRCSVYKEHCLNCNTRVDGASIDNEFGLTAEELLFIVNTLTGDIEVRMHQLLSDCDSNESKRNVALSIRDKLRMDRLCNCKMVREAKSSYEIRTIRLECTRTDCHSHPIQKV